MALNPITIYEMNQTRLSVLALSLVAAGALPVTTAGAQEGFGRPTVGVFGGVSLPSGDFNDEVGTGWHAGALLKARAYGVLDVRLDGTYSKFAKKDIVGTIATVTTDGRVFYGTLNALVNLGPDSAAYPGDNSAAPYILAGIGRYQLDYKASCVGEGCTTFEEPGKKSHNGINIGGGSTFPFAGLRTFIEARYHRIMRDTTDGSSRSMVTISAGVKIR
jgi:hypothetical protein